MPDRVDDHRGHALNGGGEDERLRLGPLLEYGSVSAGGPTGCSATSPDASITAALLLVQTTRATPAARAAATTRRVPSTFAAASYKGSRLPIRPNA
jgi:uncharacterized protein (TIGR03382 family)